MATENELQDNVGDANQIHTNEALGSGKIKVALVDPTTGQVAAGRNVSVSTYNQQPAHGCTDLFGEVIFSLDNNVTQVTITIDSKIKVRAIYLMDLPALSSIFF